MRLSLKNTISVLAYVAAAGAFTACLFSVAPILTEEFYPETGYFYVCLVYLVSWIIQRFMAGKGFSAAIYWVVTFLLGAGGFALCKGSGLFVFFGVLITGVVAPRGIEKKGLLMLLDSSIVCIMLFAFLSDMDLKLMQNSNVRDTLVILLASCALILFALISAGADTREDVQSSGRRIAGKLAVSGIFAVFVMLSAVVIRFASGGMHSIAQAFVSVLKSIYMGLISVVAFIFSIIGKIYLWLSSFGKVRDDITEIPPPAAKPELPVTGDEIKNIDPLWFKILLLVFLFAAVVFVLRKLSRRKIHISQLSETGIVRIKKQSRFIKALRLAFAKISDAVSYRVFYITRKNTVPGLVASVEKKVLLTNKTEARKVCESPQAFLRRLAASGENSALSELAELAQKHFYGGIKEKPSEKLIREINAYVSIKR